MIDLHCHVHFGVDDGPKTIEDTVALLRAYQLAGVQQIACTSHLRRDKGWVNDATVQPALMERLQQAIKYAEVNVICGKGAEHYVDELLVETCREGHCVTFNNPQTMYADQAIGINDKNHDTQWLLIELPYQSAPPNLLHTLYSIRKLGYRILLAHVERFPYVMENEAMLEGLMNAGYAIQVNLGSLAGAYHKQHKKYAERLVLQGMAHVACGDCHCAEDVGQMIDKGREALRKLAGDEGVKALCFDNPLKIINNCIPEALF